ncbi:MAG: NAD(+) diphosphatase [Clostridia bacterium]|nr:NAD(+) diphosphatase [Clostridia bacterium]
MIQDIAPHKLNNEFKTGVAPGPDSPVVCFREKEILLRDEGFFLPRYRELPKDTEIRFLFTYDNTDVFAAQLEEPLKGFSFSGFRNIRQLEFLEKHQVFLLMTALQLNNWYVDNQFCGRCATPTVHSPRERALLCPNCQRTIYPRILPAVIVAVTYKGKILLTKYSPKTGHAFPYYALVAGFTEIGETLEECVEREVMEETGVCVKNIRYYKSQPWGVVDDLLMGFFCEADTEAMEAMYQDVYDDNGDPLIRLDKNELKTGVWLTPEEMTLQPDAYSLTNEMMLLFKSENIHDPEELPLLLTRADIEKLEQEFYQ